MSTDEVLAAAASLVDAFGRHDAEAYFAAFREDSTFVFHTHPQPLGSRAEYEELWRAWQQDGFRGLSCASSEQRGEDLGGVAVFNPPLAAPGRGGGGGGRLRERGAIAFAR